MKSEQNKFRLHEWEALLIIICIKYCVVENRFEGLFLLPMSLKKPLKRNMLSIGRKMCLH